MHNRIRVARTSDLSNLSGDTLTQQVVDGQPFYDKATNKLYIGQQVQDGQSTRNATLGDFQNNTVKPINANSADSSKKLIDAQTGDDLNVGDSVTPTYIKNGMPEECDFSMALMEDNSSLQYFKLSSNNFNNNAFTFEELISFENSDNVEWDHLYTGINLSSLKSNDLLYFDFDCGASNIVSSQFFKVMFWHMSAGSQPYGQCILHNFYYLGSGETEALKFSACIKALQCNFYYLDSNNNILSYDDLSSATQFGIKFIKFRNDWLELSGSDVRIGTLDFQPICCRPSARSTAEGTNHAAPWNQYVHIKKIYRVRFDNINYNLIADAKNGVISATSGWIGTGSTARKTISYGDIYGTLPNISRAGYTFLGWATNPSLGPVDDQTIINSSDRYIYNTDLVIEARWRNGVKIILDLNNKISTNENTRTKEIYEKYVDNGGFYKDVDLTEQMYVSSNPIIPPTSSGYTFTGYWTAASGGIKYIEPNGYLSSSASASFTASSTLYAQWIAN